MIMALVIFLTTGCNKKSADVKSYMKYIADIDNGLVNVKEVDGMVVEVRYLTPEAMALNEIKDVNVEELKFRKTLAEYMGGVYFNISIKSKNNEHIYQTLSEDGIESTKLEEYLSYKAQPDFYIVTGIDTAKCTLYSYSQTYALAKQFDIAVGFENKDSLLSKDKILEFNATRFNRGLLKFVFDKNDINNVPALAL